MSVVSIVEYMHDLKEAGFTDKQSEVQARKLELVISEVKSELKKDIKEALHLDELTTRKIPVISARAHISQDISISTDPSIFCVKKPGLLHIKPRIY